MTEPTSRDKPPKWFIKHYADQFFLPTSPVFEKAAINQHANFYHYQHPDPFKLDIDWIDMSKPKKPKSYLKSIQQTKDQLQDCKDSSQSKKLHTKLKTLQTKQDKVQANAGKIIKIVSIQLKLNIRQKNTVAQWINECLRVYNQCVDHKKTLGDECPTELKVLRKVVLTQLYGDAAKPAPFETLGDEVRTFLSNQKSCLTNLARKNITHFELKPRSFKDIMSINLPSRSIKKKGVFQEWLGQINDWTNVYDQIVSVCGENGWSDCRLVYDRLVDCFLLKVPYYSSPISVKNRLRVVAVDPGEKVFMSYYSPEQSGHIGHDIRVPILKEEQKIRKLERAIKSKRNKKGIVLKNVKKLQYKRRIIYRKIKNIVTELHHQTAKWLTDKFDRVYIPIFETQKMLAKPKDLTGKKEIKKFKRLNKRYKFVLQNLSHYRFRQHLLHKAQEKGCKIVVVDESYTSQCCGGCGRLSKKYDASRIKQCQCGCNIDRDLNGARNIMLKTHFE